MIKFIERFLPEIPNQHVRLSGAGVITVDSSQLVKSKEFARQCEAFQRIRDSLK